MQNLLAHVLGRHSTVRPKTGATPYARYASLYWEFFRQLCVYFLVRMLHINFKYVFPCNFNISERFPCPQLSSGGALNSLSRLVQPKMAPNLASSYRTTLYREPLGHAS